MFRLRVQIRFLAVKNLATSLAKADDTAEEALLLYAQAAALDGGDIVLLCHMGALVFAAAYSY